MASAFFTPVDFWIELTLVELDQWIKDAPKDSKEGAK